MRLVLLIKKCHKYLTVILDFSVGDQSHFGAGLDPDPRIRTSD
jgi:hypothetical protein